MSDFKINNNSPWHTRKMEVFWFGSKKTTKIGEDSGNEALECHV